MFHPYCYHLLCAVVLAVGLTSPAAMAQPVTKTAIINPSTSTDQDNMMQPQRRSATQLSDDEITFIEKVANEVEKDNQEIDYQRLIQQAPTDNKGAFWYELAVTLSELPSNQSLDIRENGRLQVSLGILDEMLKTNADFPQIWATKIIVLKYLAHGYWGYSNALSITTEQEETQLSRHLTQKYAHRLLSTTEQATKQFPDDPWFVYEYEQARDDFSVWISAIEE